MSTHLRAANNTGWAIGIAIFAVLWVASTVAFVIYYSEVEQHKKAATDVRDEFNRYVRLSSPEDEREKDAIKNLEANADEQSVVQQLLNEIASLKTQIAGDPNITIDGLKRHMAEAERRLLEKERSELGVLATEQRSHQTYLNWIEGLMGDLLIARKDKAELEKTINTHLQNEQQAVTAKGQVEASYNQSVSQVNTAVQSKAQELSTYTASVDTRFGALQGQMSQAQAERAKEVARLHAVIEQLQRDVSVRDRRIRELTGVVSRPTTSGDTAVPAWKLPDGNVASILPEENIVFIDRGRKDHIPLGLTFEVFSRKTGIVAEEAENVRGKGTIEVIQVSENSAVCRVVRVERGQAIVEGDLVANVVYDPRVTFKFHVYGDFDLDGTGQPTITDRRRVETMISQWGGALAKNMTYDVDFLVLGKEPDLPRKPEDPLDPVAQQNYQAAQKKFETYQTLVAEARELRIPILNQNRFLILIGYYQR